MAGRYKTLLHSSEQEELHTRHRQPEIESEGQEYSDPGHSESSSVGLLQRTVARPGLARPQDMLAVSRTYGNQAVMRLVEEARLEKQTSSNAVALQRLLARTTGGPVIQRLPLERVGMDDEEPINMGNGKGLNGVEDKGSGNVLKDNEVEDDNQLQIENRVPEPEEMGNGKDIQIDIQKARQEILNELKPARKKWIKVFFKRLPTFLLKKLLLLPFSVIDQLSVADLHFKDFVRFLANGFKTRNKRLQNIDGDQIDKRKKGTAKRSLGRTGLNGYLHGLKSHKIMYGNNDDVEGGDDGGIFIPGLSSKYNPINALNSVQNEQFQSIDKKVSDLKTKLRNLSN